MSAAALRRELCAASTISLAPRVHGSGSDDARGVQMSGERPRSYGGAAVWCSRPHAKVALFSLAS